MVWLMFIPCFNLIWQFFIATRVPESLKNEFRSRGRDDGSDYGKTIALSSAILGIVSSVFSNGVNLVSAGGGDDAKQMAIFGSCGSGVLSLVSLVLFVVFWVKVYSYSSQLARDPGRDYPDDYDRRFGDYDDEPRRPPRGSGPAGESPETYRPEDGGQYR